jgi:branched-chain amino acid transport system substrate-binding protein
MKNLKKLLVVILLTSFVGFLFIGFSNLASAAPKKPKEIRVAFIGDFSGPYATSTAPMHDAFTDAVEYINKQGGVEGVPVRIVMRDTGGKVDVAISHYMEIREMKPKPKFLILVVSAEGEALRERLGEDKMPTLCVVSTSAIYPAAYTFGWFVLWVDQFGCFIDWLADNEDVKKMGRPPRLAILNWDTTFGRAILTDECYAYAKKKGIEIVATELFGVRDMDVTTQLARIRAKSPDWIYSNTTSHGPGIIAKCANQMGFKVNFAGAYVDEGTVTVGGRAMEGWIALFSQRSLAEDKHPGINVLREWLRKKNRDPKVWQMGYVSIWGNMLIAREAIKNAVKKAGWDRLDGIAIKAQMEEMRDFSPLGLGYWTYEPGRMTPRMSRIYRITNGKVIPISDWLECPDLRPAKFK